MQGSNFPIRNLMMKTFANCQRAKRFSLWDKQNYFYFCLLWTKKRANSMDPILPHFNCFTRIPLSIHNICYWLLNNAQANLMQIFRNKNVAWNLLFMKYIFQIFKGFSKCVSIGSNQTTGFTIVHICQFPRKKVKSAVCIVSKLFTA